MKKFLALVLAGVLALSLCACSSTEGHTPTKGEPTSKATQEATTQAPAESSQDAPADSSAAPSGEDSQWETKGLPGIPENCVSGRIVLTSIGQSADYQIVSNLLKKAGIDHYTEDTITADKVNENYGVIIMVVGGSNKGLGAAGLDAESEMARTTALLAKCQELNIPIVAMHTGGEGRRGTLSDSFITPVFEVANYAVVVAEGDADNFIYDILAKNNTPAAFVEKSANTRDVLVYMYNN